MGYSPLVTGVAIAGIFAGGAVIGGTLLRPRATARPGAFHRHAY